MRYVALFSILLAVGCDDDSSSDPMTADAAVGADAAAEVESRVPATGTWAVTVTLAEFGGLTVPFEIDLETTAGEDGGGTIDRAGLRVLKDGTSSAELAEATAEITADGTFELDFGTFTMPGAQSPTSGDVVISFVLHGGWQADGFLCGGVTGNIETFSTEVTESTFGAIPGGNGLAPGSCDAEGEMLPRIDECPTLEVGRNTGFMSGGAERNFLLYVPADRMEGEELPLLFLHHGLSGKPDPWGNPEYVVEHSGIAPLVDSERFIMVVPNSRDGEAAEWTAATTDNPDLAFFDDALKCVDEQFGVDMTRVHAMGHSAGGIYTTYLTMYRAELLASTAGMSPALTVTYPDPTTKLPMLVAWGGPEDEAFDQNFDDNANRLIGILKDNGHFVLACNHGEGPLRDDIEDANRHSWPLGGAEWMVRFVLDHPKGGDPYATVPDSFPEFCSIPE